MIIIDHKSSPLAIANMVSSLRKLSDDVILIGKVEELKGLEVDIHVINRVENEHIATADLEIRHKSKPNVYSINKTKT